MTENEIAKQIVDAAYKIHTKFGPGLLEPAYETILAYELKKRRLHVVCQQPVPIVYEEVKLEVGYRADMFVENKVIIELKAVEKTAPVHKKQLLTYLKLADKHLGLLINFGETLIKTGITRLVNNLEEEGSRKAAKPQRQKKNENLCAFTPLRELSFPIPENEIATQIVDAAYKIHTTFGPGLLESAYEAILAYELKKRGLRVTCQQSIPIVHEEIRLEVGCRANLFVEDKVIVNLKSVERNARVYKKQLISHLKAANKRLGLLINFGEVLLKNGIIRVVNNLEEEGSRQVAKAQR